MRFDYCPHACHACCATVSIPVVVSVSVLHSVFVGGSVVGVVRTLETFGELNNCELGVFRF